MKLPFLASVYVSSLLTFSVDSGALTLEELRADPSVTPSTILGRFSAFRFEFGSTVRKPEEFLAARAGDCDDFATLAAEILSHRGYHTHLVSVRTGTVAHVVCYVEEVGGYLDYNLRAKAVGIVRCEPTLVGVADSVARSLDSRWKSASEFTFHDGVKRLVATALSKNRGAQMAFLSTSATRPEPSN